MFFIYFGIIIVVSPCSVQYDNNIGIDANGGNINLINHLRFKTSSTNPNNIINIIDKQPDKYSISYYYNNL